MKARRHPRLHAIKIFRGSIDLDEMHASSARLTVKRGCERRTLDKDGNRVAETYEGSAALWANPGDKIIVLGPAVHEVAMARIVTVYPSGDCCYVHFTAGSIEPTTKTVKVLHAGGLK